MSESDLDKLSIIQSFSITYNEFLELIIHQFLELIILVFHK